ncbi:Uncharacterised protein [Actinobacillus equuli]|nr:Uncharacterised protein [Actinobacillus equuli]
MSKASKSSFLDGFIPLNDPLPEVFKMTPLKSVLSFVAKPSFTALKNLLFAFLALVFVLELLPAAGGFLALLALSILAAQLNHRHHRLNNKRLMQMNKLL